MNLPADDDRSGTSGCPVRKLDQPGERDGPAVEQVGPEDSRDRDGIHGPRWVIRSHPIARELLRSGPTLKQAGFGALSFIKPVEPTLDQPSPDQPAPNRAPARRRLTLRAPVLYLEGPDHKARRRSTARFFTPRAVEAYRTMVEDLSLARLAPLAAGRTVDVSELSLQLSVAVVARVVGLTSSRVPGMAARIEATFSANLDGGSGLSSFGRRLRTGAAVLAFYVLDVLPAVRVRRRQPADDLISHLLGTGFRRLEVLTECIIYCAAGMATTREFVTVAAWHLLDSPEMLARFRAGDQDERMSILNEILRVEPVVGHLYRQVTAPTTIEMDGRAHPVTAGTIIDFDLRAINIDAALVGAEPLSLCPGRPLATASAAASVLSFGDGSHRCPGGPLAMLESEIFLGRLLASDLIIERVPDVGWSDLTGGYDLRGLVVRQVVAET